MKNETSFKEGNQVSRGKGRNKRHVIEKFHYDVDKICKEHGFNPFKKLIELATTSEKEQIQLDAASELASYLAPKMKQMNLKNDEQAPFLLNLVLAPHQQNESKL